MFVNILEQAAKDDHQVHKKCLATKLAYDTQPIQEFARGNIGSSCRCITLHHNLRGYVKDTQHSRNGEQQIKCTCGSCDFYFLCHNILI